MEISDLPIEVITHIISFLSGDQRDISSASSVCKAWYVASRHPSVQPDLDLTLNFSEDDVECLTRIPDLNNRVISNLVVTFGPGNKSPQDGRPRESKSFAGYELRRRMFNKVRTSHRYTARLSGIEFRTLQIKFRRFESFDNDLSHTNEIPIILEKLFQKCYNLRFVVLDRNFVSIVMKYTQRHRDAWLGRMESVFRRIKGVHMIQGKFVNGPYKPTELQILLRFLSNVEYLWAPVIFRTYRDICDIQRLRERYPNVLHLAAEYGGQLTENVEGFLRDHATSLLADASLAAKQPLSSKVVKDTIQQNVFRNLVLGVIYRQGEFNDILSILPDIDSVFWGLTRRRMHPLERVTSLRCVKMDIEFERKSGSVLRRIVLYVDMNDDIKTEQVIADLTAVHPEAWVTVYDGLS